MRKKIETGGGFCILMSRKAFTNAGVLRFENSRNEAREILLRVSGRMKTAVLGYCIMPGEVFVLADAGRREMSSLAKVLFSRLSKTHNARKHHEGSCWKGRVHVTLIQKGAWLESALLALHALPVARRLARHPAEWACSGFHELAGTRLRYRIADIGRTALLCGSNDAGAMRRRILALTEKLMRESIGNNFFPFDAIAVGEEKTISVISDILPEEFRDVKAVGLAGGVAATALFASPRWSRTISSSI